MEQIEKWKDKELIKLKEENHNLKEQLENYIPRRRVRRVYKQLQKILEYDLQDENYKYVTTLKNLITDYRINGNKDIKISEEIIISIEHIMRFYEKENKE